MPASSIFSTTRPWFPITLFLTLLFYFLFGVSITAQSTTTWEGGFLDNLPNNNVANQDITKIQNWSNGLPGPGKTGIIPDGTEFSARVVPGSSPKVDYPLIIRPGASLAVDGGLNVEANGKVLIEALEDGTNRGTINIGPFGAINNGGEIENFGFTSVAGRLSNSGLIQNRGLLIVNTPLPGDDTPPILRNVGTIENYDQLYPDGDLELNGGSIINKAGGKMGIGPRGIATLTLGTLSHLGTSFLCEGTILMREDGIIENAATFTLDRTGELFIFQPTESGSSDKFLNKDEVVNQGKIRVVGGDWINFPGSSLVTEAGGSIILNDDISSSLQNQAGASVLIKADPNDFNPGKLFIEAGIYLNQGTTTNNGEVVVRQVLSNSGTFTNNGELTVTKNNRMPNAVPVLETDHLFVNTGEVAFSNTNGTAIMRNSGTWRNEGVLNFSLEGWDEHFDNEGYFDHASGRVFIDNAGTFNNDICGRYRHNGTIINSNRFFNNGHYYQTSNAMIEGDFPIQQEEYGFETFSPIVTADTEGLTRLYVYRRATGNNDGTGWADAINDLPAALQIARCQEGISEIFVSVTAGSYFPSIRTGASFHIPSNVKLIGGFNASGNTIEDASSRQAKLAGVGARVLRLEGTHNTEINGFIIEKGADTNGAGIYQSSEVGESNTVVIKNCTFRFNDADNFGGAVYSRGSENGGSVLVFDNCVFYDNSATWGGAVNVDGGLGSAYVEFLHCTFYSNTASNGGADVRGFNGGLATANSIFWAPNNVSSILLANPTTNFVTDCIVQGGYPGGDNILDQDPKFINPTVGFNTDLRVQPNSPTIDIGRAGLRVTTDQDGNPRPAGPAPDLGAFEFNSLLPIELLHFSAELTSAKTVSLVWETASERNNDYFTLERSSDGITFLPLAEVAGAGDTNTSQAYRHTDFSPLEGTSYYRLRQTDFDGQFSLSEIRRIDREATNTLISVFPNPVQEQINIRWGGATANQRTIRIYDALGRQISQQQINNSTPTTSIDLSHLSITQAGTYWLETQADGEVARVKVVVR